MIAQQSKPFKGKGMEGFIARWYARTRGNDMRDFRQQAGQVAGRLQSGASVLEVAPGPGFFSIELAKLGNFQITGLDISCTFVQIASENAKGAGVNIDFQLGNASAMPFADQSFDFVYCSAAFKNFTEPLAALDEMHRVLRPGGAAMVVDLRKDASIDEINAYVKQSGRSRFDGWMTSQAFRWMLIPRAYASDEFGALARESRFGDCRIEFGPIGFEANFTRASRVEATV